MTTFIWPDSWQNLRVSQSVSCRFATQASHRIARKSGRDKRQRKRVIKRRVKRGAWTWTRTSFWTRRLPVYLSIDEAHFSAGIMECQIYFGCTCWEMNGLTFDWACSDSCFLQWRTRQQAQNALLISPLPSTWINCEHIDHSMKRIALEYVKYSPPILYMNPSPSCCYEPGLNRHTLFSIKTDPAAKVVERYHENNFKEEKT
jgi:hypothetical protein